MRWASARWATWRSSMTHSSNSASASGGWRWPGNRAAWTRAAGSTARSAPRRDRSPSATNTPLTRTRRKWRKLNRPWRGSARWWGAVCANTACAPARSSSSCGIRTLPPSRARIPFRARPNSIRNCSTKFANCSAAIGKRAWPCGCWESTFRDGLSEADEEAGSLGATWIVQHAWAKIDAEFALNEYSYILPTPSGVPVFQIQTAEKVPTRFKMTARGTAGHGSLPRDDNPVEHLARAIYRLSQADQPVQLNATTRAYLNAIGKLADYAWLAPLIAKLDDPATASRTADEIRQRDPEIHAMLRTTVSATMLSAGTKINVIPNAAEAQLDGRRLPTETREEVFQRFRKIIDDPAVTIEADRKST